MTTIIDRADASEPSGSHPSTQDDIHFDQFDADVHQVASFGWRVCDARIPENDPRRLLGFVEERDGRFEVMQIGNGFRWSTFATMREALTHMLSTAPETTKERMDGELSWIDGL